jgi:Toprim-like/DNA primase catalytic core, N-terminal domain
MLDPSPNIESILLEIGYNPKPSTGGWRMRRIDGDNDTSLLVRYDGSWKDFVDGDGGKIDKLIQKTLNLNKHQFEDWIKTKSFNINQPSTPAKPNLKMSKLFDKTLLNNILPIHDYAKNRGISEETCRLFKCGLVGNVKGRLNNRYVFPVFNKKGDVLGFVGRSLDNQNKYKYICCGDKNTFVYPAFVNFKDIQDKKEVIICESPFDALSLYECGIKHVLCLFGVEMNLKTLNFLLRVNPKIVISLNNDSLNGGSAGNEASNKLYRRLCKYFDARQLEIKLPPKHKDWNETLMNCGGNEIFEFFNHER